MVELDTVRREWTLTDAEGNAVATVTDDRVTGRTLGAETGATLVGGDRDGAGRPADPAIRRDVPDSVHAMRMACRRMRSTLQSFRALLDRERTDAVVAELRWLAGELGGARDLARSIPSTGCWPPLP